MAIQFIHAKFLLTLRAQVPGFAGAKSLMDIGEQNWFSKQAMTDVLAAARELGLAIADEALPAISDPSHPAMADVFGKAKLFYHYFLGIEHYEAIDLHGTKLAKKIDLNLPYEPPAQFDIVLNFGTTEHVFNQYEAFNTIHKICKPNGFMVHGLPASGGREHGFFNYHATAFFDLARSNGYEIKAFAWKGQKDRDGQRIDIVRSFADRGEFLRFIDSQSPREESFFVCFQKTSVSPFMCPMQAVYDAQIDERTSQEELHTFWLKNR